MITQLYGWAVMLSSFVMLFIIQVLSSINGLAYGQYSVLVMTNVYGENLTELILELLAIPGIILLVRSSSFPHQKQRRLDRTLSRSDDTTRGVLVVGQTKDRTNTSRSEPHGNPLMLRRRVLKFEPRDAGLATNR